MREKSLLFVVNALGYGGAEVQVSHLGIGLRRRGWDVGVVTLTPPVALAERLTANGIDVYSLDMRRGFPNPLAIGRLRRIIRARRPWVVHSHIVHANLLARVTRPLARMPVLVCTAHSVIEGSRMLERAYRVTDRLADLTTNVSRAAVDRYIRVGAAPAGRIRFVPNGLDLSRFHPDPDARARIRRELGVEDQFVWLAVGRFTEAKDYPNMLRAFAQLAQPRAVLLLVGRGELEQETREVAAQLGVEDRVRFVGVRDDVPEVMNAADAYCLSSAWEGMPLVLQEASATCLPIAATDVGGNREVVADGRTGLLAPPGDSSALAEVMRRIASLPAEDRRRMGEAGREHVRSLYSLEAVLDQWESIYEELSPLPGDEVGWRSLFRSGRRTSEAVS